jgi:hypothetical protein
VLNAPPSGPWRDAPHKLGPSALLNKKFGGNIMRLLTLTAIGAAAMFANVAVANAAMDSSKSTQLSQSECTNLWQQANPGNADKLSESQVAPYITNFKAANPDGDNTIEMDEWNAACQKGLVKSPSSTGASPGSSGESQPSEPY